MQLCRWWNWNCSIWCGIIVCAAIGAVGACLASKQPMLWNVADMLLLELAQLTGAVARPGTTQETGLVELK